jgi:hypothetical protein
MVDKKKAGLILDFSETNFATDFLYHGYSYNKNVITKPLSGGFSIQLKGGYK